MLDSINRLVVTQIQGHLAGSLPPPHYGIYTMCNLHLYHEKTSALSSRFIFSDHVCPTIYFQHQTLHELATLVFCYLVEREFSDLKFYFQILN